jgi:hypothetical protein
MEANAISTLFTNNLEIDENVEVGADLDPTTFVLNIIEICPQQPNILVASISSFTPSTTKLQQLIKKVNI